MNKTAVRKAAVFGRTAFGTVFFLPGIFSLLCVCCAFADLRSIGVSTVPESPWALLRGEESPVIVRFDTEMEKSTAENVLRVYSSDGAVDGKLSWKGSNLYFTPEVPWKPGVRYALELSGTVSAVDGRELLLSRDIPFYAVSLSPLPHVISFSPLDGASVGSAGIGDSSGAGQGAEAHTVLEIRFSHPMESLSTEDALRFDVPGVKKYTWRNNAKTLRVGTDKPLNPWTVYSWSISEKALSMEGAPLAKEFSGRFITNLDKQFINVVKVVSLMPPKPFPAVSPSSELWGSWAPLELIQERIPGSPGNGNSLPVHGPGFKQGIGVEFSKPPESGSLRSSFSFVPNLPGRVEILSPVSAVFIPSRDMEPETVYSLCVSGSLKDGEGLKMGKDYRISFTSDIPFLKILSFSSGRGEGKNAPEPGSTFSVPVSTGGIIRSIIHFSLPFNAENYGAREECVFRISLSPLFPGTLPSVSLRSASWLSEDRLLMEWAGPEGGTQNVEHFYRLLIPGGSSGIHNGKGSYLKEDFVLYIKAEQ